MSTMEEKAEGLGYFLAGRAERKHKDHLKGESGYEVLAVELKQGSSGVLPGKPDVMVPTVVALNTMPQVSVWERVRGTNEDTWVFAHRASYDARWDTDARRWEIVGVNQRESKGWPALTPLRDFSRPKAERNDAGERLAGQHQPTATWADVPVQPVRRKR